jgi:hypothetical protein
VSHAIIQRGVPLMPGLSGRSGQIIVTGRSRGHFVSRSAGEAVSGFSTCCAIVTLRVAAIAPSSAGSAKLASGAGGPHLLNRNSPPDHS